MRHPTASLIYCSTFLFFFLMGPGFWEKKNWVAPLTISPAVNKLELNVGFQSWHISVSVPRGRCIVSGWLIPLLFSETSGDYCASRPVTECLLSASSKAEGGHGLQGPSTWEQAWFFFHCLPQTLVLQFTLPMGVFILLLAVTSSLLSQHKWKHQSPGFFCVSCHLEVLT